jgi:phage minor structural protein
MIYIATNNLNDGFPLSNAYDDVIYQKANSEYYLKFRYPIDRFGVWKNLTCETVLKADDTRGFQLFRIKKINEINGYIRVYAKHITDDINFIEVNQLNVTNATGKRVMTALAGSIVGESRFVFDSDIATMHTLNLSDTTVGDILSKDKRSIIGQWGGELVRNNFLINLKARGGVDTEILFMNKKNVKNQDNLISTENLITRLKLSVEVEKENNEKEVIKATVESPYINTYPRVYTGYLKVTDKNVTDREKLIEYGNRYFRNTLVDFPKDNLTVNVIDKNQERINLFDTVWFRNVEYGIDKRLKVVAYEYSPMSKRYIKISFGALKINSLSQVKNLNQLKERIDEKIEESRVDAFKIQKNLADLLKKDRTAIEEKMKNLEEQSKAGVEVKKALFEKDGTVPPVTRTKILDAVEADIARLKTIITEAEMVKAIQAHLNYAEIKTALIDKAFITQILSDETFRQQFEAGEVTTQNIFTKMRDSIQSSIKKEFITKEETKQLVNDLTIGADGIRQITQEETNKIIDNRKDELKGKDGKVPAFNQLIGSHFPSLNSVLSINNTPLKLNLNDYNGHNSIEVDDKSTEGELKGFAVPTSIREMVAGKRILMRIPVYIFPDSAHTSIRLALFPLVYDLGFDLADVEKGKWVIKEIEYPFTKSGAWPFKTFIFGTFRGHFKIAEPYIAIDDTLTDKWLPAIEDMKANNLTASARIEGSYLNENLMNCKVYLDVYSNGEIVRASTTEIPLKIEIKKLVASGYIASGEVTLDSNGLVQNINIPNGVKDGKPIEVVFEVTCGENKTVASARLNNTIDKQLLTETISKVKTFESTLDKFESKISEVDSKRFKLAYTRENLCSETAAEKKGSDLYFNAKRPLEANKEYYVLADVDNVPENQNTRIYGAKNNGDGKLLVGGLNIWKISFEKAQTNVNIFPLGGETKVKNVQIYEVPETEEPKEDIILPWQNSGGYITLKFKRKLKSGEVLTLTFDVEGTPTKRYGYYYGTNGKYTSKPILSGKNSWTFRLHEDKESVQFTTQGSGVEGKLSNVKCVLESFAFGYKTEYNISEMESTVRQTKSEIEHAVRKDNFGTVLTQNAEYLRLAWNNISKFIQFENGGMSFYEGGNISQNKLTARVTDQGYQFWRDGYELGSMGTNKYKYDDAKKGIQFDLEYDGWFMGWAYRVGKNDSYYTWKWIYTSGSFADYESDSLNAGCNVNLRWHYLKKARINPNEVSVDGAVTDTIQVALADGGSVTLRIKNGFILA